MATQAASEVNGQNTHIGDLWRLLARAVSGTLIYAVFEWLVVTAAQSGLASVVFPLPLQDIVLILVFPLSMILTLGENRSNLSKFLLKGDVQARQAAVAQLIFYSLFFFLNSPLLQSVFLHRDMYGLFRIVSLDAAIAANIAVNSAIATISTCVFILLPLYRYRERAADEASQQDRTYERRILPRKPLLKRIEEWPLYESTYLLTIVPLAVSYFFVFVLSWSGLKLYFAIVLAFFWLALLGLIGYSHPANKVGLFASKLLLVAATFISIVSFIPVVFGAMWLESHPPLDPVAAFSSFFVEPVTLQELSFPDVQTFVTAMNGGLWWMVIADASFLELVVAPLVIFTIYTYQFLPAQADDRKTREEQQKLNLVLNLLSDGHRKQLLKILLDEAQEPEDQEAQRNRADLEKLKLIYWDNASGKYKPSI